MEHLSEQDVQKIEQFLKELEQQRIKDKIILNLREKKKRK